jgi:hypothetical protein
MSDPVLSAGQEGQYNQNVDRPIGVVVLTTLNLLIVALVGARLIVNLLAPLYAAPNGLVDALSVAQIALSLLISIGLWRMEPWGYIVALAYYALSIIVVLYGVLALNLQSLATVNLIPCILALLYLLTPGVRHRFMHSAGD